MVEKKLPAVYLFKKESTGSVNNISNHIISLLLFQMLLFNETLL